GERMTADVHALAGGSRLNVSLYHGASIMETICTAILSMFPCSDVVVDCPSSGIYVALDEISAGTGFGFSTGGASGSSGDVSTGMPSGGVAVMIGGVVPGVTFGDGIDGVGNGSASGFLAGLERISPVRRSRQMTSTFMYVSPWRISLFWLMFNNALL